MQSLFDSVDENAKLPEERPPRSKKGVYIVLGILAALAILSAGGFVIHRAMYPPRLVERPVPQRPDELLTELKVARDGIDIQTRDIYARIQQFNQRMETQGRRPISFSQVFLQGLSSEEEQALDQLVKNEKDPSYRGVLSQVVEDMKQIRDLQNKVSQLEAKLPGDGVEAKAGDTHLKLAQEWLAKTQKLPPTRAKELAERLNLMDGHLEKGNKVFFYYDPAKDFFGTWVAQGGAKRTPLAVVRAKELRLIEERDTALAKAKDLEEKRAELEETLAKLQTEIADLEVRKATLETNVSQLEADKNTAEQKVKTTSAELEQHKNSLFYEADLADRLRARGILTSFNRVDAIGNVKFASFLDLSKEKSITLKPSQFGIDHIRDVRIVPSFLKEGREIGVKFGDDGTVEVTVLDEKALRGQKVLFVVEQ